MWNWIFPEGIPVRKRLFDLVLAVPILIMISPFLLLIGLLVRIRMGTPVMFTQLRPGMKGAL